MEAPARSPGRRVLGPLAARLSNLLGGPEEAPQIPDNVADVRTESLTVAEDAAMHERWQSMLKGRKPSECSDAELRRLVDDGAPLKHRLDLWVLCAYAAVNPAVGYCQGMSFIAAVPLLLAFSEADALAALRYVVEQVCPGYHGASLEGYFCDLGVLDALTSQLLPEVHAELVGLDIPFDIVYFPRALSDSRAACADARDVPTDAAQRFLALARSGISADIDAVLQCTRRFIPLVLGDLGEVDASGRATFLDRLRAQFRDQGAAAADGPSASTALAADGPAKDVAFEPPAVVARVTLDDGREGLLRMGAADVPRAAVQRFLAAYALDEACARPLTEWLTRAEANAEQYPVRIAGKLPEIRRAFGHRRS
ncbi:unnamed protein product [Prorocentrum cordatum]|uniref:Rab-GAP TBC domain-containing protein n=1 Tax=Prorocentrum cordatum TaxID=2364126 RepID=A0ABN9T9H5_9DINO|nr:unnamed protein product [Polarella glacialis]